MLVTLEPFHLVNTPLFSYIEDAAIPTVIVSAHELEGFIAAVFDQPDIGSRLMRGIRDRGDEIPSITRPLADLEPRPNQILTDAWDEYMAPVMALDPEVVAAAQATVEHG